MMNWFQGFSDTPQLNAVLFDLDGTLINSIDIYFMILQKTFETLGIPPISKDDMISAASTGDFRWERVFPELENDELTRRIADCRRIINDITPGMFRQHIRIIPGAMETLRYLAEHNMKMGLVTSTPRTLLEDKFNGLNSTGLRAMFQAIITTDDVNERKPSPTPLLECGRLLGVSPKKSVYVGDTRTDIMAAKAAGMRILCVLTGLDSHETLMRESPDGIMESVKGLGELLT